MSGVAKRLAREYTLSMHLGFTVHLWQEGTQFVAHALPIDIMSSGPSPAAARAAVDEAVMAFISAARDAGTLDEALEDCGYTKSGDQWRAPDWVGFEHHTLPLSA
jgi:hypothetical protein